jgi:hypothetical protein
MEPTDIPTLPSDPAFYKWLAGISVTMLFGIVMYMAHGAVGAMKKLGTRVDDLERGEIVQKQINKAVEKELKDLGDELIPIKQRVFPVQYVPPPGYKPEDWNNH